MGGYMFGLGATKAGSSWLHRYLSSHPQCAMPWPKELHYFDHFDLGENPAFMRLLINRIFAISQEIAQETDAAARANLAARRARLVDLLALKCKSDVDIEGYKAFLARFADENTRLMGDITPAYAALPLSRLQQMADMGGRFVYILRDPVERLWSHLRMNAARAHDGDMAGRLARLVKRVLAGQGEAIVARGDYAGTLARLDRAAPKSSVFVGIFETFFNTESIARLCAMLGISFHEPRFEQKINSGQGVPLDSETRGAFSRLLRTQYEAMEARFGALPEAWKQNMVKV